MCYSKNKYKIKCSVLYDFDFPMCTNDPTERKKNTQHFEFESDKKLSYLFPL